MSKLWNSLSWFFKKFVIIRTTTVSHKNRLEVSTFPSEYLSVYVVANSGAVFYIVIRKITFMFAIFANFTIYFFFHFIHHL